MASKRGYSPLRLITMHLGDDRNHGKWQITMENPFTKYNAPFKFSLLGNLSLKSQILSPVPALLDPFNSRPYGVKLGKFGL